MESYTAHGNYIMVWDNWLDGKVNEDQCRQRQEKYRTASWVPEIDNGAGACVELMAPHKHGNIFNKGHDHDNCNDGAEYEMIKSCIHEPRLPKRADVDKLADKYRIDFKEVFTNAVECATNNPGDPDIANMPQDGKLPHCYFRLHVKRGTFQLGGHHGKDRDGNRSQIGYWESKDIYDPEDKKS
jgi:hypothetical protein